MESSKQLSSFHCRLQEVTRILAESRADIQVDPLLHRACAMDLKHYCADIPLGEGRRKFIYVLQGASVSGDYICFQKTLYAVTS